MNSDRSKRAAILGLLTLVLLSGSLARASATTDPPTEAYVNVDLRAGGNDGLYVCADNSLGASPKDVKRALKLGADVARALHADGAGVIYDPAIDDGCIDFSLQRPLTIREAHRRAAIIDASAISRAVFENGISDTYLYVCVPALAGETSAGEREDEGCDFRGYFLPRAGNVRISFEATGGELLGGLAFSIVFWLIVGLPAGFFVRRMRRNDRWDWFRRHRIIGWLLLFVPALFIGILWGVGIAYDGGLLPAIQMFVPIGVTGEVLIALVPALAFAALLFVPLVRGVKVIERRRQVEVRAGIPPVIAQTARPDRRAQALMLPILLPLGLLWFGADFSTGSAWISSSIIIAAASLFAIALAFEDRILVWAHRAREMAQGEDRGLRSTLKELGLPTNVYMSERPLVSWRPSAQAPLAGAVGQRIVLLWDRTAELTPRTISGGLVGALGLPIWLILWLFYLPLFVLTDEGLASDAPELVLVVPVVIGLVALARELVRRTQVRKAVRKSSFRLEILRGMLFFGRINARLAAAMTERIYHDRSRVATFNKLNRKLAGLADPGGRAWRTTLKSSRRFAQRANITEGYVDRLATEVIQMVDI